MPAKHKAAAPADNTRERRSGPGERRKHEEQLNPAGNRFRMKWWTWWESAHINIRTGPPDRRHKPSQDSAIGDETSQRPTATAPEQAHAEQWLLANERKVRVEARAIKHDNGINIRIGRVFIASVMAEYASSLLAERDRTIAELRQELRQTRAIADPTITQLRRALGQAELRAEQAEQQFKAERAIKEAEKKILLEEIGKRKQAEQERGLAQMEQHCAERARDTWITAAECLRGLLRGADRFLTMCRRSSLVDAIEWEYERKTLRQRIQKELEGRP